MKLIGYVDRCGGTQAQGDDVRIQVKRVHVSSISILTSIALTTISSSALSFLVSGFIPFHPFPLALFRRFDLIFFASVVKM